jgi:hypothetical protein
MSGCNTREENARELSACEIAAAERNAKIDEYIETLPIVYRAQFVPFSKSRNAKPGAKWSEMSLNWRVAIVPKHHAAHFDANGFDSIGAALVTNYSQGIGHIPGYKWTPRVSVAMNERVRHCCEAGTQWSEPGTLPTSRKIPAPLVRDILHSLILDADAIEYPTFEEWASNCGYDADSRAAEKIYRQCLEIGLKLRALIGDAAITALRDLFQDY